MWLGQQLCSNPFRQRYNVARTMEVPVLHRSSEVEGYALSAAATNSQDHIEGRNAFLKKRKPVRQGK